MKKTFYTFLIFIFAVPNLPKAETQLSALDRLGLEIDAKCNELSKAAKICKNYVCETENPIFRSWQIEHKINRNVESNRCEYHMKSYSIIEGEKNVFYNLKCDMSSKKAQQIIENSQGKKFADWGVTMEDLTGLYQYSCNQKI